MEGKRVQSPFVLFSGQKRPYLFRSESRLSACGRIIIYRGLRCILGPAAGFEETYSFAWIRCGEWFQQRPLAGSARPRAVEFLGLNRVHQTIPFRLSPGCVTSHRKTTQVMSEECMNNHRVTGQPHGSAPNPTTCQPCKVYLHHTRSGQAG